VTSIVNPPPLSAIFHKYNTTRAQCQISGGANRMMTLKLAVFFAVVLFFSNFAH
jgi:hypothetical protein